MDTQGNLVVGIVHPANVSDRHGADWVLEAAIEKSGRLGLIWVDGAYTGELVECWQDDRGIIIEIVGKQPNQHTLGVVPRRWSSNAVSPYSVEHAA